MDRGSLPRRAGAVRDSGVWKPCGSGRGTEHDAHTGRVSVLAPSARTLALSRSPACPIVSLLLAAPLLLAPLCSSPSRPPSLRRQLLFRAHVPGPAVAARTPLGSVDDL